MDRQDPDPSDRRANYELLLQQIGKQLDRADAIGEELREQARAGDKDAAAEIYGTCSICRVRKSTRPVWVNGSEKGICDKCTRIYRLPAVCRIAFILLAIGFAVTRPMGLLLSMGPLRSLQYTPMPVLTAIAILPLMIGAVGSTHYNAGKGMRIGLVVGGLVAVMIIGALGMDRGVPWFGVAAAVSAVIVTPVITLLLAFLRLH